MAFTSANKHYLYLSYQIAYYFLPQQKNIIFTSPQTTFASAHIFTSVTKHYLYLNEHYLYLMYLTQSLP